MTPSKKCVDLIKSFEGFESKSYLCPAKVWTIGYGSTMWEDGKKVQAGQTVTPERAEVLLAWEVNGKSMHVYNLISPYKVSQHQFDALVSFAYNCGVYALKSSTLLKKVRANANDQAIRDEFNKWVKGGGKTLPGLVRRRKAEADLYFTK